MTARLHVAVQVCPSRWGRKTLRRLLLGLTHLDSPALNEEGKAGSVGNLGGVRGRGGGSGERGEGRVGRVGCREEKESGSLLRHFWRDI